MLVRTVAVWNNNVFGETHEKRELQLVDSTEKVLHQLTRTDLSSWAVKKARKLTPKQKHAAVSTPDAQNSK